MTVSTTSNKITYQGDGATTSWSFSFALTGSGDIQLFVTDSLGHVTQPAVGTFSVTVNAPVAPNPTSVGGSVLYPVTGSPLAIGNSITIARIMTETQPVSISNQSIIYPPVVETTFDRLMMIDQQLSDQIGRAVAVGIGDVGMPPLPPPNLRANLQAVFDSSGNLTAGGAVIGTIISAVMTPVVTAPTLPLAQAAMGVAPTASPTFTGAPQTPTGTFGENDGLIASTAFVQAQLSGLGMVMTTGDLKPTHKTVADPGWILWVDGTIGDATSGSSVRANADTTGLFALYYNGYSDALCPVLTSTGVATTRVAQGTAAVAFAAHCRMNLPKGSGRGLGVAGAGSGLTTRALGSTFGAETVAMTVAQMPSHIHTIFDPSHAHNTTDPQHNHAFAATVTSTSGAIISPPATGGSVGIYTTDGALLNVTGYSLTGVLINGAQTGIQINPAGSGAAMNVMNPMAYVNIMIKL